jgi:putative oxidoreductase
MTDKIDRTRLYVPALGGLYEALAPFSYAFMRFSAGAIMVPHGVQKLVYGTAVNTAQGMAAKGFPFPLALAYWVGFVELFVAAALAVGLFTRLCAAILWIEMAVIIIWFTGPRGYFWGQQSYEFSLLWLLLFTAIFFRGGGPYSVDHYLRKEF